MNLRDLEYFCKIAEVGSLSKASEVLGRSQPALSVSVRRLEESLGAQLFAKKGRSIELTPAGQLLLLRAIKLNTLVSEVGREIQDYANARVGKVRIGTGATFAEFLLPPAISQVLRQAPEIELDLVVAMSDVLREKLRAGHLDLVVGPLFSQDSDEFIVEELGIDVAVVAGAHDHPLAGRKVELKELAQCKWMLPAKSVTIRQWIDAVFQRNGLQRPRVALQSSVVSWVQELVLETGLLTFMSSHDLKRGTLTEIQCEKTRMYRKIGVVVRKDMYFPPAAKLLVESLHGVTADIFSFDRKDL